MPAMADPALSRGEALNPSIAAQGCTSSTELRAETYKQNSREDKKDEGITCHDDSQLHDLQR